MMKKGSKIRFLSQKTLKNDKICPFLSIFGDFLKNLSDQTDLSDFLHAATKRPDL